MNFFTSLALCSVTLLTAVGAEAAVRPSLKQMPAKVVTHDYDDDYDYVIFEQPEGEFSTLSRDCDGFTFESFMATHSTVLGSYVGMVDAGDGTVYLSHIASEYPVDTWVKATREDNTLSIKGPQPIYIEYDYDEDMELVIYVVPMQVRFNDDGTGTFVPVEDLTYRFNVSEDGKLTAADPSMLLGICVESANPDATGDDKWVWRGFGDRDITMTPITSSLVTPPADATVEEWVWQDPYDVSFVKVITDGADIYVQGMDRGVKDSWLKGTVDGDKVRFASGQFMGTDYEIFYLNYFFGGEPVYTEDPETGANFTRWALTEEAVFSYDAENKKLTADGAYVINSTPDRPFVLYAYTDVTVGMQHRNPDAAPAAPYDLVVEMSNYDNYIWVQIPAVDVDGNLLDTDRLYYEILMDGEVYTVADVDDAWNDVFLTLIPYNWNGWDIYTDGATDHTIYFYDITPSTVGVRSVYINENGDEIRSALTTCDTSGVSAVMTDSRIISREYYDLQGRRVAEGYKGISICVTKYADGRVQRDKIAR